MSSQAFLDGMRAYRRGQILDPAAGYEWRRGWEHAQFNATQKLGLASTQDPCDNLDHRKGEFF